MKEKPAAHLKSPMLRFLSQWRRSCVKLQVSFFHSLATHTLLLQRFRRLTASTMNTFLLTAKTWTRQQEFRITQACQDNSNFKIKAKLNKTKNLRVSQLAFLLYLLLVFLKITINYHRRCWGAASSVVFLKAEKLKDIKLFCGRMEFSEGGPVLAQSQQQTPTRTTDPVKRRQFERLLTPTQHLQVCFHWVLALKRCLFGLHNAEVPLTLFIFLLYCVPYPLQLSHFP